MSNPIAISIQSNIKEIQSKLSALHQKQVPFASALALTSLAKLVQAAETDEIKKTFPSATPFTQKSVGMKAATKASQTAEVYLKDIAASYLRPYAFGGVRKLTTGKNMLEPVNVDLNQYGNIARSKIKQLKGRPDVFVGAIKTKSGETINGVWRRTSVSGRKFKGRGSKALLPNNTGRLKLIIRIDPVATAPKQHLGWKERAEKIIKVSFNAEFDKALAKAIASAR